MLNLIMSGILVNMHVKKMKIDLCVNVYRKQFYIRVENKIDLFKEL